VIASGRMKTRPFFESSGSRCRCCLYRFNCNYGSTSHSGNKVSPQTTPPQLVLYDGTHKDELDVERAAKSLANFLNSCVAEMRLAVQAVGKNSIKELNRDDLVSVDRDLAEALGIRYAGHGRK